MILHLINFLTIFLEAGMPIASWVGVLVAIVTTLIGFLAKDVYDRLVKRVEVLEKAINDAKTDLDVEKERSRVEMRNIDTRINELHINILDKLDEIKYKFNEFRK